MDLKPFFVTGLALGSIYALSGLGLVVLYRATAVVNFAYGATGAIGALVAWEMIEGGNPEPLAWAAGVATSTLLSVFYGCLVAPRLADRDATVKAGATIGFALFLLGFAFWRWSDTARSLSLPTDDSGFDVFGVRVVYTKVIAVALAVIVTAGVGWFLRSTRTGLAMRAMANDRELAAVLGVRVVSVGGLAWLLNGVLSGVTGILVASLVRLEAGTLTFLVIPAAAAAIIGRLTSLTVTLAGGLALGVVESVAAAYASVSDYRGVAPFLVAILVLVARQRQRVIPVVMADGR